MSLDRFNTDAAAWEQFSPTPTDLTRPDATDTPPVDVVTKNIDRPIEEIGLEENLREATAEVQRRREATGDPGVDDRAPIQKWEARFELTGEHESPHRRCQARGDSHHGRPQDRYGPAISQKLGDRGYRRGSLRGCR